VFLLAEEAASTEASVSIEILNRLCRLYRTVSDVAVSQRPNIVSRRRRRYGPNSTFSWHSCGRFPFSLQGQKVHQYIPVEWTQGPDCIRKDLSPVGKHGNIYHVGVGGTARPEWITVQRRNLGVGTIRDRPGGSGAPGLRRTPGERSDANK